MRRTALAPAPIRWVEQSPKMTRELMPESIGLRVFAADVADGGHLSVIVAREPLGPGGTLQWHLSMSHRIGQPPEPGRYPTWDEIADARYRFVPDEVTMAMLLPPKAEYVNLHGTTFHLHQVKGE